MTAEFAVHAGVVRSKEDGQMHRVSVRDLVRLYELRPGEWIAWDKRAADAEDPSKFRHLYPRVDGCYHRPRERTAP